MLQQSASGLGIDQIYSGIARFPCDSMAFLLLLLLKHKQTSRDWSTD